MSKYIGDVISVSCVSYGLFCSFVVFGLSVDRRKRSRTVAIRSHRFRLLGTEVGRLLLNFGAACHNLRPDLCRILA